MSVRRVFASVVQRGRIGRKRSFAIALVVGLLALPVTEALAYFNSVGSGSVSNIQAVSSTSTVSLAQNTNAMTITYTDVNGASTTALSPGGTAQFNTIITCTAQPPCTVPSVSLAGWTSNKTGCDSNTMGGSFAIKAQSATWPQTFPSAVSDAITVVWNILSGVDQSPCLGAAFTFQFSIP